MKAIQHVCFTASQPFPRYTTRQFFVCKALAGTASPFLPGPALSEDPPLSEFSVTQ
jgi:hypothetical protein